LAGVGFLPAIAALTLTGKDFARQTFDVSFERAYQAGLKAMQDSGKVKKKDKAAGEITATVNGADVVLKLNKVSETSTEVTISARKFLLPQPEVASGVLYRMSQELKKPSP
jgi:hypothetical protein